MESLTVEFPSYLAMSLKMENAEFLREIKIMAIVKMYELGKVSSGTAAKILEMERIDFLEILKNYKVSYIDALTEDELRQELNAI